METTSHIGSEKMCDRELNCKRIEKVGDKKT